ncbi:hypothetical protein ACVWW3_007691 [Bradyrhizobium sp. LM2.9]
MAWSILLVAGLLEVAWAIGLKYTEGFTKPVPSVLTLAAMAGSVILLGLALKDAAHWNCLCGLDRHRCGRHRSAWHHPVRRTGRRVSLCQHRTDRRRHCRAEARVLTKTSKAVTPTRSAP